MAFQLDHNIFFNALGAQQQKQQSFFDQLARGFQAGQNAQDMDMKRRQMEAGGDLPATIQIANEIQKAIEAGDMERANLLHQVHKTMDKGILPYGNGGQQDTWGMLTGEAPQAPSTAWDMIAPITEDDLNRGPDFVPQKTQDRLRRLSVSDLQSTGDPAFDQRRAQMYEENAARQNNGDPLRVTVGRQPPPPSQRGPVAMPGYGEAVGSIEAAKKGMGRQAEKNVDLAMNPQIARGEQDQKNQSDLAWKPKIEEETTLAGGRADTVVEQEAKSAKDEKQAGRVLDYLDMAEGYLPQASGGLLGTATSGAKGMANFSDESTQANEQLRLIGGWLMSNVPRMEGPQSNFDVLNYQKMAADVGNTMKPIEDRLAAVRVLRELQQKYANDSQGVVSDEQFNAVDARPVPTAPQKGQEIDPGRAHFDLRKAGFTDEQIREYMKSRGIK